MAEQDFKKFPGAGSALAKLGKIAGKGLAGAGKHVGRKSMPRISITIDEEFRLPDDLGGQQLEDEDDISDAFPEFMSPGMEEDKFDFQKFRGKLSPDPGATAADMLRRGSPRKYIPPATKKSKRAQRLDEQKKKKEKD